MARLNNFSEEDSKVRESDASKMFLLNLVSDSMRRGLSTLQECTQSAFFSSDLDRTFGYENVKPIGILSFSSLIR